MPDPRFFRRSGQFPLAEVARRAGAEIGSGADASLLVSDVASLAAAGPRDLSYVSDPAWLPALATSKCGVCLVKRGMAASAPAGGVLLFVDNPRLAFALVAAMFYPDTSPGASTVPFKVADSARIHPSAVIGPGVEIGENVSIGANCTLTHCVIGARCTIHPGVQIGQDGFGFVPGPTGLMKMPQLGRVIIGTDVEIGANCCIDRGALEDTEIGDGTKFDNLVQVGHNARIGRHCVFVAQSGVAGSCTIGDGVLVGGQVAISDHVTVGAGAQIAGQSGVVRDVAPKEVVMGTPARPIRQFWREIAALSRLTKRGKSP